MNKKVADIAGIGIGPFNLSIAALLKEIPAAEAVFFERKPRFDWHPGLMFREARMQTSFLKDLVTAVRPTSPYSFVNYLVNTGKFYPFLSASVETVGRQEFTDYMGWVTSQLDTLRFGTDVQELQFVDDHFLVRTSTGAVRARNVSLGSGRIPHIPEAVASVVGDRCFHAINILARKTNLAGARVAIVGGGQTGAEVFLNTVRNHWGTPREVLWVSRRLNFEPLDETPFTNELFMPDYVRMFHTLDAGRRRALVEQQKLAGDGISPSTLREIYRELYELRVSGDPKEVSLLPARDMIEVQKNGEELGITTHNRLDGSRERHTVDAIILCTGFVERLPAYLEPLQSRLHLDEHGRLQLGRAFDVQWDGPPDNRIYGLNLGRYSHGIAESQLSLAAWRSGVIINHLLGRPIFDVDASAGFVRWGSASEPQRQAFGA
ncbi:lysine N(6)-hydroxylase/L-ornithine N(5)-oxygenase family protein [Chondromyces crocatus]|uniref:Lysine 6-monooxygenase n=1 Tax=Chondromyces crocatus TaxID=52 RepID=A0A0K1EBG3_CHOCO|nr:SidA/IucD/PvdA family monooxygenase [Chondromyces crocatus]AKT38200.1 lysine 6-monooxygenase [Chondromyces crocatus]